MVMAGSRQTGFWRISQEFYVWLGRQQGQGEILGLDWST